MEQEEVKIIVFYVDVRGMDNSKVYDTVKSIQENIDESPMFKENITTIIIPVLGNTRIECINPKYIVEHDLISKHNDLMKELHDHLEYQIQQLKTIKESSINKFDELKSDESNG